jgi:ATP synthase protein I
MSSSGEGSDQRRGEMSPEDREALKRRAEAIGKHLDEVQSRKSSSSASSEGDQKRHGAALGQAFRISVELVAGVVVGGFIGWVIDRQLGTKPWLFIVFVMLGFAAGMLNVIRSAQRMQAASEPMQRKAPSVKDKDDEGEA